MEMKETRDMQNGVNVTQMSEEDSNLADTEGEQQYGSRIKIMREYRTQVRF